MADQTNQSGLNIYQKVNKVMSKVAYVKKDSAGFGGSKGVKYDVAIAALRASMIEFGIVFTQTQIGETKKAGELKTSSGGIQYLYKSMYRNRLVNIDDPTDCIEGDIMAHATDNGDKAPGKTSTYSAKVFLIKVFSLESGDDEESRSEIEEKKQGVLPATVSECQEIWNLINKISDDRKPKCYENLLANSKATQQQIADGKITQMQAFTIKNIMLQATAKR